MDLLESKHGVDNMVFDMQESNISNHPREYNDIAKTSSQKEINLPITAEVLPRLENYRHSKRTAKRPSLGELHGQENGNKDKIKNETEVSPRSSANSTIKLGWIQGVLIPCLLNIWGVMLFLRLSWVVAEAGIGLSLAIIAISTIVCIITTLSLSAICTNGEVKGGGMYYIISRSLGPEFGASVGIVFAFANTVSASMNTIGFCNSLSDLLKNYGCQIVDGGENDARIIGSIAIALMILICAVGMDWETKVQNFLVITIIGAMLDFIVGTILGPHDDKQRAEGFVGFNSKTFSENWGPMYRPVENVDYEFFQVFAIFFPSVTGIQAGANISGDLKDPANAIPKGTFLSVVISMTSYALFVVFAGGAASRDATGNISDYINGNMTLCTESESCKYGLFNNYQMMQKMSLWEPLIYAGCFAATLSTALTNLLSVPRLIQALGVDEIYPGLIFFSKGYGKHGEPYRGYILTLAVSVAFLLIANLNAIAPLISNFYLASYALINFCTFHAALVKPLGWRPTFKYYSTWLSLFGFSMCVGIMFLINWWSSVTTFILILGLYLLVVYRKPDVNWGSSTQAQTYKTALTTAQKLIDIGDHVKNYKPQILLLCADPQFRQALVEFAYLITKNNSLLIIGEIKKEKIPYKKRSTRVNDVYSHLRNNKIKAFYNIIDNTTLDVGARYLLQSTGIGKLKPNVLMMGYKDNWIHCNKEELLSYFNILHVAFEHHVSVVIMRVEEYLDNRKSVTDETGTRVDDIFTSVSVDSTNNESITDHAVKILHKNSPIRVDLFGSTTFGENTGPLRGKQNKENIDVWWLYDDGGLTILIPYIISTRSNWSNCNFRVFALITNENNIALEEKNMAHLLSKFRLRYDSLTMVSINDKPQNTTIEFFEGLLSAFKNNSERGYQVTDSEIFALQEKTFKHLRLRELLLRYSKKSNLIIMSLPMPRKGTISAPLYMAWLEVLTKDMPTTLFVRGNQQSVLTVYS